MREWRDVNENFVSSNYRHICFCLGMNGTITLTFGDRAENHKGMQILGRSALEGFSLEDLMRAKRYFESKELKVTIYHLNKLLANEKRSEASDAYLLVVPNGVTALVSDKASLRKEQDKLKKDTQAFMYGRIVNKKARHNLCFADEGQAADFQHGKGTVVAFEEVPMLKELRENIEKALGEKGKDLVAEGNYYYDVKSCFIGYHGDGERKRVVAIRLGASFPLHYQWYQNGKAVGPRFEVMLNDGDVYVMSEKSVGTDWKLKKALTLRHAAGFHDVLKLPKADALKGIELLDEVSTDMTQISHQQVSALEHVSQGMKRTRENDEHDDDDAHETDVMTKKPKLDDA